MTDVVVRTTAGEVGGRAVDGVSGFYAVPFAAPPVGPLRFAAPAPVEPWDGVRPCTERGPTALQPAMAFATSLVVPGDDILHLNVHTPSADPAAKLPVYVWIHGGGWVMGSNADQSIDGARLASRGMVVVSVQYRLGVEGFAALEGGTSNRAVRDWLAALRWVQENVAAFGGDPEHVTIGGHSAGSAAVLILSALPAARGLFDRVLAMSGVCWNLPSAEQASEGTAKVAAHLGVPATADAFAALDPEVVLAAQAEVAPFGSFRPDADPADHARSMALDRNWLAPHLDGDLLADDPYLALLGGSGRERDLLIGSTLEEVDALFTMLGASMDRDAAEAALVACGIPAPLAVRWFAEHPDHSPAAVLGAAVTALVFRAPGLHIAEARADGPGRTWVYETTWKPPTMFGSVHGLDVPYAFDNADAPGLEVMAGGRPPQSIADDLAGAVAAFVIDGDPGWTPYADDRTSMRFDLPSAAVPDADALVRAVFPPVA